jgi:hypothetical protein
MTSFSLLARAAAFAAGVNLSPAAAQSIAADNNAATLPQTSYAAPAQNAAGTPHWEWQYHYVGRHARYEGHWSWYASALQHTKAAEARSRPSARDELKLFKERFA